MGLDRLKGIAVRITYGHETWNYAGVSRFKDTRIDRAIVIHGAETDMLD